MRILLLGSGGREHALAWKISQSPKLEKLFIAPGNAGTSQVGENVAISVCDFDKIAEFGDVASYLMGDLNAKEDSETIQSTKEAFDDAKLIAGITDDSPTFHGWGQAEDPRRIDYIMISKGDADVFEYHVVKNLHGDVYSSDHSSIYIKTKLK